jgi:hypothetical protein
MQREFSQGHDYSLYGQKAAAAFCRVLMHTGGSISSK